MPEPALKHGNRRYASAQDTRRPKPVYGNHLRVLLLRYRSARLHLQRHREGAWFLQQLQEVSVAEQDAVDCVKDVRESSRAQWPVRRQFEPQRLEGIFALDRESDSVCVRPQ